MNDRRCPVEQRYPPTSAAIYLNSASDATNQAPDFSVTERVATNALPGCGRRVILRYGTTFLRDWEPMHRFVRGLRKVPLEPGGMGARCDKPARRLLGRRADVGCSHALRGFRAAPGAGLARAGYDGGGPAGRSAVSSGGGGARRSPHAATLSANTQRPCPRRERGPSPADRIRWAVARPQAFPSNIPTPRGPCPRAQTWNLPEAHEATTSSRSMRSPGVGVRNDDPLRPPSAPNPHKAS